jgi:hypothetical protein
MVLDFEHRCASHCENGATMNIFKFYGVDIDEPLTFGIGSGMYFGHLPFMKNNHYPVTTFRGKPGKVFKRVCKQLNVKFEMKTFKDPDKAMAELDRVLATGNPVGLQAGTFHLPYFPPEYRMHFNAHNLVCCGKEGDDYIVSDPVIEKLAKISYEDLKRVRYAKGANEPNGKMYYITKLPASYNFPKAIVSGIKITIHEMVEIPFPLIGCKGIKYLSKRMRKWPKKHGSLEAARNLAQVVLTLEEVGTGGSGYRFIYGAFLKEAAPLLNRPELVELSKEMGSIANQWREFSYLSARNCKGRGESENTFDFLADKLLDIAEREEKLFKNLKALRLK